MNAPIIETARLRLRGHRADDLPSCLAMWSDPIVTRFIGGKPSTEQQTWARILSYAGHWQLCDFGYWAMEKKDTGTFVGEIGFADFKRPIVPAMRTDPELGFALAPAFHGQGYASEAIAAVLDWGNRNLPTRRTVCMIVPDNVASLHVIKNFDYHIFKETSFNDAPILFLERRS